MTTITKSQKCIQCGQCCKYEIPITLYDINLLAKHLEISSQQAFKSYIQKDVSPLSGLFMIEKNEDRSCVFLNEKKQCSIHVAKPMVCAMFNCKKAKNHKVLPWTASCEDNESRLLVYRQSIAVAITRSYIERHGANWNEESFLLAVSSITKQTGCEGKCNVKLSKDDNGNPLAMVYSCENCQNKKQISRDTPITLDDISRISKYLRIEPKSFFKKYLSQSLSTEHNSLKLKWHQGCVLLGSDCHCSVETVRPMHCQFTPCPSKAGDSDTMDRLFLGSGTLKEQFRHQLAMQQTKEYVDKYGAKYKAKKFIKMAQSLETNCRDHNLYKIFCKNIAPYRYLDDTQTILQNSQSTRI